MENTQFNAIHDAGPGTGMSLWNDHASGTSSDKARPVWVTELDGATIVVRGPGGVFVSEFPRCGKSLTLMHVLNYLKAAQNPSHDSIETDGRAGSGVAMGAAQLASDIGQLEQFALHPVARAVHRALASSTPSAS